MNNMHDGSNCRPAEGGVGAFLGDQMYSYSRTLRAALLSSALCGAAFVCSEAFAQSADAPVVTASATTRAPASPSGTVADSSSVGSTQLNEVVVTGVATAGGLKKLNAAYSVTTLSQEQIKEANTTAFADILKSSPGLYVESSGGPTGANVEIAGFPGSGGTPYVSIELNGASVFASTTGPYLEPTTMFRLDDAVERLELVQDGPGVLYGNGQPGLTVNYLLKQGTDKLSGDYGLTYGSEGSLRFDGFVGGPLSAQNGLYGSVGGFWTNNDDEVRNPQFTPETGGQLTATLTKKWADGSLLVYGRYLKYEAQFEVDTPIEVTGKGQFAPYPGFSPLTGTLESKADQYEQIQIAPCTGSGCTPTTLPVNLANGRGPNMYTLGGEFKWNFDNGLQVLDDLSYSDGADHINAFYSTSTNPESLSTYISNAEASDKLPVGLVASAYYTNTGAAASLTQNVFPMTLRYAYTTFHSASNEIHLNYDIFRNNTLTVGNYSALYGLNYSLYNGENILLQAISNPTPIGVNLTNGVTTYQLASSEGFVNAPSSATHLVATGFDSAFFVTDRWKVGKFLFDAGVRVEHDGFYDHYQNTASGSLSGNPYELYNTSAQYLIAGSDSLGYSKSGLSWTVGLNYEIDPHMSAYIRVNEGVHFPSPSDITATNITHYPVQTANNYQFGYKIQNDLLYADVSAFYRTFSNVSTSGLFSIGGVSETLYFLYGETTEGLEYQIELKPLKWLGEGFRRFTISATGDYSHGTYNNSNGCVTETGISNVATTSCNSSLDFDGYLLARQPVFQTRITPAYTLPTNWGFVRAWTTYEYIGDHYSDQQQAQYLGTYYDLSFGITGDVGNSWEWTVRGANITNQIGLTEGNSRVLIGSATSNGVVLARSIEGREINAQIKYKF